MFKQLTNVQAPKSDTPELMTTPGDGTIKITEPGAKLANLNEGDYVSILEDTDPNSEWNGLWLVKGNAPEREDNKPDGKVIKEQFGSKLGSVNGKGTGPMQFGSKYAYKSLGGNDQTLRIFTIGEGKRHPDFEHPLHKLEFEREAPKADKAPNKNKKNKEATQGKGLNIRYELTGTN